MDNRLSSGMKLRARVGRKAGAMLHAKDGLPSDPSDFPLSRHAKVRASRPLDVFRGKGDQEWGLGEVVCKIPQGPTVL